MTGGSFAAHRAKSPVRASIQPITEADAGVVADFLACHMDSKVSVDNWARAVRTTWDDAAPNHGFMLTDGGAVVGVHLAFYSTRWIRGRMERFCNLGPWCVLDSHRAQGLRLLQRLLGQPGYHFTDLSPSGTVVPLNLRLKFQELDTTTALVPNLPWPSAPGGVRVTSSPRVLCQELDAEELAVYRSHVEAAAARHVLVASGSSHSYVMFRKDRRKGLPLFATIIHVSNPEFFRRTIRPFSRHLLLRHGIPLTLVELRVAGGAPRPSIPIGTHRHKMFRSPTLTGADIDYLYSELTCISW
jgi:hypothetical protein